jgi:hypothetical protein
MGKAPRTVPAVNAHELIVPTSHGSSQLVELAPGKWLIYGRPAVVPRSAICPTEASKAAVCYLKLTLVSGSSCDFGKPDIFLPNRPIRGFLFERPVREE